MAWAALSLTIQPSWMGRSFAFRSSPHVEPSLTRLGGVVSGSSKVSSKHPGTLSGLARQPVSLWFRLCSQRRQASHTRRSHLFLLHADLGLVWTIHVFSIRSVPFHLVHMFTIVKPLAEGSLCMTLTTAQEVQLNPSSALHIDYLYTNA